MGMTQAKSLIEAKDGLTFLDVIARQVRRCASGRARPCRCVLMNSFHTRDDSLAALAEHPELESTVPADFVQHKEPKLLGRRTSTPVEWPDDPVAGVVPAGARRHLHGAADLGDARRAAGRAASATRSSPTPTTSPRCSIRACWRGWRAEEIPFVMEVTDRTEADRKGGHIASGATAATCCARPPRRRRRTSTRCRTSGATATSTRTTSGSTSRRCQAVLDERDGVLGLPLIVNKKTVDPGDKSSPAVFQLETAMGAAVGVVRGRPAAAGPAHALLPGEDHRGPAGAALRRLRAGRRRRRRARPAARRPPAGDRPRRRPLQAAAPTSTRASRRARRRWWSASGSRSRATWPSARDVVVRGTVRVEGPREVPDGEVLEG